VCQSALSEDMIRCDVISYDEIKRVPNLVWHGMALHRMDMT
jgi:hypothetical protein